jgi:glycosyltransferase involved in cell wall biosynthesis/putative flippase GtrA
MTQTLPHVDEVTSHAPSESTSSTEAITEGARANYFLKSSLRRDVGDDYGSPVVELAIPVFNEGHTLEASIRSLRAYLDESFPFHATIRIIDNASTDDTWAVASRLASAVSGVSALQLEQKGKGRAIRAAWSTSSAQVVAYMDVDLSTHLTALLPLVAPILSGHSDIAIGSRLAPGARVLRGARRELVSRTYQFILRLALRNQFSDATCGFKAARRETAEMLLPLVSDEHWFFDTELLVLAERNGFRIHEVPVDWIDDADSRVGVRNVALSDLKGIARLLHSRATGQERRTSSPNVKHPGHSGPGTRYAGVGVISTIAYLAIFFTLRRWVGIYAANVFALALSTVGNTIAHARFTFGPKSGLRMRQAFVAGGLSFITAVALTTLALGLEELVGRTSVGTETLAILVGTVAAGFVRLVLLRASAYRDHAQNVRKAITKL